MSETPLSVDIDKACKQVKQKLSAIGMRRIHARKKAQNTWHMLMNKSTMHPGELLLLYIDEKSNRTRFFWMDRQLLESKSEQLTLRFFLEKRKYRGNVKP